MKNSLTRITSFVLLSLAIFFTCLAPTGCSSTKLAPGGIYQGDAILYTAEKAITTSYKTFHDFVQWEMDYRQILPVEVSRAADVIRVNGKKWITSAEALRDAYVASPTVENKNKLTTTLNIIDAAIAEATKYTTQYKPVAPVRPTTFNEPKRTYPSYLLPYSPDGATLALVR